MHKGGRLTAAHTAKGHLQAKADHTSESDFIRRVDWLPRSALVVPNRTPVRLLGFIATSLAAGPGATCVVGASMSSYADAASSCE
jgi:hypothetical protein